VGFPPAGEDEQRTVVDTIHAGLATRYQADLRRPVLSSAHAASYALTACFEDNICQPRARLGLAGLSDLPATEAWWHDKSNA